MSHNDNNNATKQNHCLLVGVIIILMVLPSLVSCYGLVFSCIMIYMDASAALAALVLGILHFTWNITAIFSAQQSCKSHPRLTLLIGSTLAVLGITTCFSQVSFAMFCILYGLLGGLSLGVCFGFSLHLLTDVFVHHARLFLLSGNCIGVIVISILLQYFLDVYLIYGTFLLWSGILLQCWIGASLIQQSNFNLPILLKWSANNVHKSGTITTLNTSWEHSNSKLSENSHTLDSLSSIEAETCDDDDDKFEATFLDDRGWRNPFYDRSHSQEFGKPYIGKIMWYSLEILPRIPEEQEPTGDSPTSSCAVSLESLPLPDCAQTFHYNHTEPVTDNTCEETVEESTEDVQVPTLNLHYVTDSLSSVTIPSFKNTLSRNNKFFSRVRWKRCRPLFIVWCVSAVCIRLVHISVLMMLPPHGKNLRTHRIAPVALLCLVIFIEALIRGVIASVNISVIIRRIMLIIGLVLIFLALVGLGQLTTSGLTFGCCIFYSTGMGLVSGIFLPLMVESIGVDVYIFAAKCICVLTGLVTLCFLPIWGFLYDFTLSWSSSWLCLSCVVILPLVLLLLEPWVSRKCL